MKLSLLFLLMFSLIFLLNLDFTLLRSIRNTLTVVDLGGGAQSIALFELCGTLPAAIAMTWLLAAALRRWPLKYVFLVTLAVFLLFFFLFSSLFYPLFMGWRQKVMVIESVDAQWVKGLSLVFSMTFYVMAELWKPALMQILFWGLVNQHMGVKEAKSLYAPLLLGSSLGAMAAAPLLLWSTSPSSWRWLHLASEQWSHALILNIFFLCLSGLGAGGLYYFLAHRLFPTIQQNSTPPLSCSLKQSVRLCCASGPLRLLAWIVLADYIAYSLGELLFLDILKEKFPTPCDYCAYLGKVSFCGSLLTIIMALTLAPWMLRNCRWSLSALTLPCFLLLIELVFFVFLRNPSLNHSLFGWSHQQWLLVVVWLGSIQYSVCRALKYTLFDASKELAFVLLPENEKMKGKLVIDGICARLGRGGSSGLSLFLISIYGSVIASSFLTTGLAILFTTSWLLATRKLGALIEPLRPISSFSFVNKEKQ